MKCSSGLEQIGLKNHTKSLPQKYEINKFHPDSPATGCSFWKVRIQITSFPILSRFWWPSTSAFHKTNIKGKILLFPVKYLELLQSSELWRWEGCVDAMIMALKVIIMGLVINNGICHYHCTSHRVPEGRDTFKCHRSWKFWQIPTLSI